jgi:hypothetical protein
MESQIIVGTIRARKDAQTFMVVTKDGTTIDVAFDGEAKPLIGGDVVGNLRHGVYGEPRLTLKRSLTEALIEQGALINIAGAKPDQTARILAKYLARSRSAVISPGSGMSIQRMPHSTDPDLEWAMRTLSREADRRQVALNVIDVKAIAASVWQTSSLRDFALPADVEGNRRSVLDLSRVLRSGFHPVCSRMVENLSGNSEISVNFVMPYSPFTGITGFARHTAHMNAGFFPFLDMTLSDARRLSSAKMIGLAMAHNVLGAGGASQADVDQSPRTRHLANCFADALTSLAYLTTGGNPKIVEEYANLREASICFGYDTGSWKLFDGVLEEATHLSIRSAIKEFEGKKLGSDVGPEALVDMAVRIARKTAFPAARFAADAAGPSDAEMQKATDAANSFACDLRPGDNDVREAVTERYTFELRQLVQEHGSNQMAGSRLIMFGSLHMPLNMDRVFDRETFDLSRSLDLESTKVTEDAGKRLNEQLADRIRLSRGEKTETRTLQFGELLGR